MMLIHVESLALTITNPEISLLLKELEEVRKDYSEHIRAGKFDALMKLRDELMNGTK